jgi:hypothetical protein
MNPAEKGWLPQYIDFRKQYPIDLSRYALDREESLLYQIMQPTGLIYGHPLHTPELRHPKVNRWNSLGKMKVVLFESFLYSATIHLDTTPQHQDEWRDFYMDTGKSIGRFYSELDPKERISKPWYSFSKRNKIDEIRNTERILHKRLFLKSRWNYFWASLFNNSLLFLDTYYFGQWRKGTFTNIKWHKDAIKLMLLKVIASAAHANHIIEREERSLFNTFLNSASLTKEQEKTAKSALKDGIDLNEIDLKYADSWILRKYVLEVAILTIWSDKVVTEEEKEFLTRLAKRLNFTEEELDTSLIAIESFVVENWKDVYFLQNKHSFQIVSETILKRVSFVINKHKDSIAQEIRESKELWQLLDKSRRYPLSDEEQEKVRVQLIDILKTIPAFVIIALPGTFLTLPVLLKVLPKSVFPSSFHD